MLRELRVRNLALIAAAELEFGAGLTVLSGETGAGKTALLSSLKLLVGERGDTTVIGNVGTEARVEAVFTGIGAAAQGSDLDGALQSPEPDAGEHLVVRRITAEGRSRCYLDDSLVTVGTLGNTLGPFVDLYGQHEHQSLLKTSEQLGLLDEFAGSELALALSAYQQARHAYGKAADALQQLQDLASTSGAEREQAAFVLREMEKIAPLTGEYEDLERQLPRLRNGEQLASAAGTALELLRGEAGALERLDGAARALGALKGVDTALDEPLLQLQSLTIELEELASDIKRYAADIEYDPQALRLALDRLGELDGLSRRFGPGMEQVFALKERSERLLQRTEDTETLIKEAEQSLQAATRELEARAAALATLRQEAAGRFVAQLGESIAALALTGASLEFSVQELSFAKWGPAGSQSYELLYRPAPTAAARPLAKIASGGELSRVMLGIKSLLQTAERPMTLVFDEIDAGIGGKTANAVAERLAGLAQQHQVIVITHLAQIAAVANHHFLVSKTSTSEGTATVITALSGAAREKELARMLSGSTDAEALTHARKLLKEARQ